jgi:ADP-heptose:LPS heptosyltransferase
VVISVDTSLAHLSGALGRPTWVLLPFNPDWRWMRDREDTPWYPTMKLYRHQVAGRWDETFGRVARDLEREFPIG